VASRKNKNKPASPGPAGKSATLDYASAKSVNTASRDLGRSLAGWLFPSYLALVLLGCIALRIPGATITGNELGATKSLFTAVNAATLTGFQQDLSVDKYPAFGQVIIFVLTVGGSLMTLVIGGLAMVRILRLPYDDLRVIAAAGIAEGAAIVIGTVLLLFDRSRTFPQAVFQSASAFGNSGLAIGPVPGVGSWQTHMALLPLAALGGFGLIVLMELYDRIRHGRAMSLHSRVALGLAVWIYIIGTIVVFLARAWSVTFPGNPVGSRILRDLIASSAMWTINARSAGLPIEPFNHLTRATQWVILGLAMIGGAAGGTAGGIKTTTLYELSRGARRLLNRQNAGRSFGIAVCWVAGFVGLVWLIILLLLAVEAQLPIDRVIFAAISAVGNVGIYPDEMKLSVRGMGIVSLAMLAGRLLPLIVLWWMADTVQDADIAVG
jgi:trk system potassium uptake protein TrkH